MDTSVFYRLTNNILGRGQSLDVVPDGSGQLMMAPAGDYSGQLWRLVGRGDGKYALRTSYLGDCFSLDVINDGVNTTPCLAATGEFTGQLWTLTPWPDGTYRLTNDFTGPNISLDTSADTHDPWLSTGDHPGQHWTLTKAGPVPGIVPIPALNPKKAGSGGAVEQTEGPTDFTRFARPQGVVKAVMIFVDFPDAPAKPASADATADHLLGGGKAQQLYRDQSYGRLTLDVTVRSDLGWRRLQKSSTSYDLLNFDSQREYIGAAAAQFHPAEIKFSDYQMVFVVAADTPDLPLSPAFTPTAGWEATSPSGKIRLAVTLGHDSYSNRYINLVHEIGHLFGLPDLYPTGQSVDDSAVGCWSIMCDIFHSVSFLGWHRHKNGWLPAARATYLKESTPEWYATLSPLSGPCGLSLIVVPVDDVNHPSKVFVIELAQPVLGSNDRYWGEGVLIYTVDATIPTGASPVVVIPRQVSDSNDYGHLYQAPYGVGDVAHARGPGSVSLKAEILQKFGSSYSIKIAYQQ
jgi:M6 family metalloprotease-like protein